MEFQSYSQYLEVRIFAVRVSSYLSPLYLLPTVGPNRMLL
jgi:hypothetical protein